jgi:tight adherence protein C
MAMGMMGTLLAALISLMVTGGVVLMIVGYAMRRQEIADINQRMATFALRPKRLEELELSRPFFDRVIQPMLVGAIKFMSRFTPQSNLERLRQNLEQAGNPNNWSPADFMGVRGLSAVGLCGATLGLLLLARQNVQSVLLFPAVMLVVGYILPGVWLGQKISQRKRSILKALPDAIDLLSISVEAGLGFDQALSRVAVKWDNELSWEFQRTLSEIRVGKSRREALKELASRTGVDDLSTFVTSIVQADQLGVSITQVLRIQSAQLRQRRRQRAEEQAHKAPIKMLFPMVFLIFPAIYVIILGPAVPQVLKSLGQ